MTLHWWHVNALLQDADVGRLVGGRHDVGSVFGSGRETQEHQPESGAPIGAELQLHLCLEGGERRGRGGAGAMLPLRSPVPTELAGRPPGDCASDGHHRQELVQEAAVSI